MHEQDAGRAEEEWYDHDEHESSQSMAMAILKTEMIRYVLCLRQGAFQDATST